MDVLDPAIKWVEQVAALLGVDAKLIPAVLSTAIGIRFLRAAVAPFASGWMYAVILPISIAAACTNWFGGTGEKPGMVALAFMALTLLIQRALQGLAEWEKLPEWLRHVFPEDNKYVKPEPPKEV